MRFVVVDEEWRPVAGFDGFYEVSNMGRVRSVPRIVEHRYSGKLTLPGRILKMPIGSTGYYGVHFCKDGKHKPYKVHRIVAEAFVPNPWGLNEVNHINLNKLDNMASNLEWCTREANIAHAVASGVCHALVNPRKSFKLNSDQVDDIRKRSCEGETQHGLARAFGVSQSTIRMIVLNRNWVMPGTMPLKGSKRAKLSENDVYELRWLYAHGFRRSQLAKRYGLHPNYIGSIVNFKKWPDARTIAPGSYIEPGADLAGARNLNSKLERQTGPTV